MTGETMVAPIAGVAESIALAEVALAGGDPVACGHRLGIAYVRLRQRRHSADANDIYDSGRQILALAIGGYVPALLDLAGTVRDDRERWRHYRTAQQAILSVLRSCEAMALAAPGRASEEDLASVRAYCAPLLEGSELAIGADLA
jgi:hypothetical protein